MGIKSGFTLQVVLTSILLLAWGSSESQGASLGEDEAKALSEVAKELGTREWKFSPPVDLCKDYNKVELCVCSSPPVSCHVKNITIKKESLAGVLPMSLAKLPYLQCLDLTRNYLNGSIPPEWANMSNLQFLELMVNRLSGPIPGILGTLTNLTHLSIENNMFSGSVPAELGKLVNLKDLVLSANNLTGRLPKSLINLHALTNLRISSNSFRGKIPDYFQSWPALTRLEIQGSGFRGPVPPSISALRNLTALLISDLHGHGERWDFPNLQNAANLETLVLRNCKISGPIPPYLFSLRQLKSLDLSFNNLTGSIPLSLQNVNGHFSSLYLTSNFLTGPIPDWIQLKSFKNIDLSYNNFNESSVPASCTKDNLNFFRSSSVKLNSSLAACLKTFGCHHDRYSLHINCGGKQIKIGNTIYEDDSEPGGSSKFYTSKGEWGFSSTGDFWKLAPISDASYIAENESVLAVTNADLYTKARTSGVSLTYYGRCLAKGNYTVTLYFAEIKFRNDDSYYRLGRRIFDVYIQDKLRLPNFDIVKAANGSEKACNATFRGISVPDGTIEIRFYYAGKGTAAVPDRGVYGPLISAISVESEFRPPPDRKLIIGIVLGSLASVLFLVIVAFIWWRRQTNIPSREEVLRGIDLQTVLFTYLQIKAATDNFDPANKIGEGGFGSVYRGTLLDGTYIAVKRLSSKSSQGNKEFVTEIGMISGLHHPNLAKLYGCCVEGSQLFLVYEFMVNNNLARALFDEDWPLRLDWPTRQRVCIEIARGLVFLHHESAIKIVHRDIKPTNILLDENLNAKISDFGLARLREEENTHISTRVAGTVGYMSPEYALWGYLTYKADVYSFGVVALEIVAGRSNMDFPPDEYNFCLLDWAVVQQRRGNLMGIIDAKLGSEYDKEEAVRMIKIALLCTNASPALRPTMSQVVSMLEGNIGVEDSAIDSNAHGWMAQLPARQHDDPGPVEVISETRSELLSLKDSSC